MPCILVEIAFLDALPTRQDINAFINLRPQIAASIANGIRQFVGISTPTIATPQPPQHDFQIGDIVRINHGAIWLTEQPVPQWAIGKEYTISQISATNALIKELTSRILFQHLTLIRRPSDIPNETDIEYLANNGISINDQYLDEFITRGETLSLIAQLHQNMRGV